MGNTLSTQTVNQLAEAVGSGNLRRVRWLIAKARLNDQSLISLAEIAAREGHRDILIFLLRRILNQHLKDCFCLWASVKELRVNRLDIGLCLIQAIANQKTRDLCCAQLIEQASQLGHWSFVTFLVQLLTNRTLKDQCCARACKVAAVAGEEEIVKLLVEAISDVGQKDRCCSFTVESAASQGRKEICEFLVRNMSEEGMIDEACFLAAKHAARHSHMECLSFLVLESVGEDSRDQCCMMALNYAAIYGQLKAIEFLTLNISDQRVKDKACKTAIEFASAYNHPKIVIFLLSSLSDNESSSKDYICSKAAELSARRGHFTATKIFVKRVANEALRQECCRLCAEIAGNQNSEERKYLLSIIASDQSHNAIIEKNLMDLWTMEQRVRQENLGDSGWLDVAKFAAKNRLFDQVASMINNIENQQIKDSCCLEVVSDAASCYSWSTVEFLVNSTADKAKKCECSMAAIECAARSGNIDLVKRLAQEDADKSLTLQGLGKAVVPAAIHGHLAVLQFLIDTISDKKLKEDCCVDAAEASATWGRLNIAQFLVDKISSEKLRNECCKNAAKTAEIHDHFEVELLFLDAITGSSGMKDQCCEEHAKSAAAECNFESASRLIQLIDDQDLKDKLCMDFAEQTLRNGKWEMATTFMECTSSPMQRDYMCSRIAELAVPKLSCKSLACIAEGITDASLRDQFLMHAAQAAMEKAGKALFCELLATTERQSKAVDTRKSHVQSGFVAIPHHWLARSSRVRGLISNLTIAGENSILHCTLLQMEPANITQLLRLSITEGHVALAFELIKHEKFSQEVVDLPDSTGATALMLAAGDGHYGLILQLLKKAASVHAEDNAGRTALSRACENGHLKAAKVLVDRGADPFHQDARGMTCQQIASGHTDLASVLRVVDTQSVGNDKLLSENLHQVLNAAGFTQERAACQQILADWLEGVARVLNHNGQLTGSFADGWANSLTQVNGRTAADSDIDWTVLDAQQVFHLEGGCEKSKEECLRKYVKQCKVVKGHALVDSESGSQPAISTAANGVRPAHDLCHAIECCSSFCEARVRILLSAPDESPVHLVFATRPQPNATSELRVSFSFQEKRIIRRLSTVQGQLFAIIKFIFKRYLPKALETSGLKTYHAKTLVFFMLEKYGLDNTAVWQGVNLLSLLKESLDMMLDFFNKEPQSPDVCMPHFFIPKAPLYFKNAGLSGDFNKTKTRVRNRLCEVRNDVTRVVEQLKKQVQPLQSYSFYFHLYCLLPLAVPQTCIQFDELASKDTQNFETLASVYSIVVRCLTELQSTWNNRQAVMRLLSHLHGLAFCKCAIKSLTAMAHLKFDENEQAKALLSELREHPVKRSWKTEDLKKIRRPGRDYIDWEKIPMDVDWAWRFCVPCNAEPKFAFLPEFTQSLFTARLSQPRSSHLFISFRCLSWSLQAELLPDHVRPTAPSTWFTELHEDPDLEELLTLAHYSNSVEHLQFCLQQIGLIRDEKRMVLEQEDEKKIQLVRMKLKRIEEETEM